MLWLIAVLVAIFFMVLSCYFLARWMGAEDRAAEFEWKWKALCRYREKIIEAAKREPE